MDTLAELVTLRSFKVHANCRWVGQIVNSGLKHPVKEDLLQSQSPCGFTCNTVCITDCFVYEL